MHIQWCPTGPFVSLPVHAAAAYSEDQLPLESLSDYVMSSYTPTLSALLFSLPKSLDTPFPCKVLAVIQPNTPKLSHLPGAIKELSMIEKRVSESGHVLKSLVGNQATVDTVLGDMKDCSVVHFACHGIQDATDPLNSRLILDDGPLPLSKLIYTKLPNAQLAFLSACQTAKGEKELPDEAVHLAAGMLAAGFKSVIGTMWSISDNAAPIVADGVYARLFKDGKLESGKVAEALHYAVEDLRKRDPSDFMAWVPFIHMGK